MNRVGDNLHLEGLFNPPKRSYTVHKVIAFLMGVVALLFLFVGLAHSQTAHHRYQEGEIAQALVPMCENKSDAEALLNAMHTGGFIAGKSYIKDAGNTCDLPQGVIQMKIGKVQGHPQMVEGKLWVVISVSSPNDEFSVWAVCPASAIDITEV